jgi:3-hydroxyisobutyrate dehydrogenase
MNIGLIGTGLMGLPMANRLLEADLSVMVYNRTAEKIKPLAEKGSAIASSPEEVLSNCDCIFLMLTDANAIREVLFSESTDGQLSGRTIISMSTIAPSESQQICSEAIALGGEYIEAPVLGSIPEAKTGQLIVMVGSTPEQFQTWLELLKNFSPEPKFIGPVGTATTLKLALNQLIANLTTGFALSLGLIQQQGVNIEVFMEILRQSALYAPTFDKKLQRMIDRNFTNPNFPTKHLLKDTNLILSEAKSLGLNVSSLEGVRQILELAMTENLCDRDYSSLFNIVNPSN